MVILILWKWPFWSARNGHSNDIGMAILIGITMTILMGLKWSF